MNKDLQDALNAFTESPQLNRIAASSVRATPNLDSLSSPLPDPSDKIDNRLMMTNDLLQRQLDHAVSEAESAKKEAKFAKRLSVLSVIVAVTIPFIAVLLEHIFL